jgi:hypothetical protein
MIDASPPVEVDMIFIDPGFRNLRSSCKLPENALTISRAGLQITINDS